MSIEFLDVDTVLDIHAEQLAKFGGAGGLRDRGLLESAVAQPMAGFGGVFAHPTLLEMAAAYLFHIVSNHPFVDGNKRTGLLAALDFLGLNGLPLKIVSPDLYALTIAVAEGKADKTQIAATLARFVAANDPR
ncbi:MAG: type II toxin-antitoxin system death-on-curing family toxin [Myxococcales bacterium]|nr:type II toxin-antitoxin system death-on-curing family toxin [Myxococcales bacterium]